MPGIPASHKPLAVKIPAHSSGFTETGGKYVERKLTGRPWRRLRERILQRDLYLCQRCLKSGYVTVAREVDHIEPVASGENNAESNLQSLCRDCHYVKSASEGGPAATKPVWLPKPACKVILVTGPPGAGKTTYALEHRGPIDTVIDLDDCFLDVCGIHGHQADKTYLNAALRLRNDRLAELSRRTQGCAYYIACCPDRSDALWWLDKLSADHVELDPGLETIRTRVPADRLSLAETWYQIRART